MTEPNIFAFLSGFSTSTGIEIQITQPPTTPPKFTASVNSENSEIPYN